MAHQNNILKDCVRGALIINAIMEEFKAQGEQIDEHFINCRNVDGRVECYEHHVFDPARNRTAGLSSTIVTGSEMQRWIHLGLFLDFRLPQRAKNLFHSLDELEGFMDLLIVDDGDIEIGPLFDADPLFKSAAEEFVHLTREESVDNVGRTFWSLIMRKGGPLTLIQMGHKTYEEVIKPRLLAVDPQCFD